MSGELALQIRGSLPLTVRRTRVADSGQQEQVRNLVVELGGEVLRVLVGRHPRLRQVLLDRSKLGAEGGGNARQLDGVVSRAGEPRQQRR